MPTYPSIPVSPSRPFEDSEFPIVQSKLQNGVDHQRLDAYAAAGGTITLEHKQITWAEAEQILSFADSVVSRRDAFDIPSEVLISATGGLADVMKQTGTNRLWRFVEAPRVTYSDRSGLCSVVCKLRTWDNEGQPAPMVPSGIFNVAIIGPGAVSGTSPWVETYSAKITFGDAEASYQYSWIASGTASISNSTIQSPTVTLTGNGPWSVSVMLTLNNFSRLATKTIAVAAID